eukprot:CCRYP_015026-RG/>CCRYP_015026-RG protein AED:0.48 eAED:1.00 QI:0/0/0/1/0/0/3/0/102
MTTLKVSLGILLTKEFAGLTTSEVPATIKILEIHVLTTSFAACLSNCTVDRDNLVLWQIHGISTLTPAPVRMTMDWQSDERMNLARVARSVTDFIFNYVFKS